MNRKYFFANLFLAVSLLFIAILLILAWPFNQRTHAAVYGVSFSRFHTDELGLDFRQTFLALLDDLGVRHFRFSAHWPLTEPAVGVFNFSELDFQIQTAQDRGADAILAVGRRLPGWPECHTPTWADSLPNDQKRERLLEYIAATVSRYKGSRVVTAWQVENEPYLAFFSRSRCGPLDEAFLQKEIDLVHQLDPSRPVLLTDSGEFGRWLNPFSRADMFGTSIYLYIWSPKTGPFRYPIVPAFFRIKHRLIKWLSGKNTPSIVIELSAEPWLTNSIVSTPIDIQLERMGPDKFQEVLSFAQQTGFNTFYLWGAEWWYWLKIKGRPEIWDLARQLFVSR